LKGINDDFLRLQLLDELGGRHFTAPAGVVTGHIDMLPPIGIIRLESGKAKFRAQLLRIHLHSSFEQDHWIYNLSFAFAHFK